MFIKIRPFLSDPDIRAEVVRLASEDRDFSQWDVLDEILDSRNLMYASETEGRDTCEKVFLELFPELAHSIVVRGRSDPSECYRDPLPPEPAMRFEEGSLGIIRWQQKIPYSSDSQEV